MEGQIMDFVKYVIEKDGIETGFSMDELCAQAELLDKRRQIISKKKDIIDKYEPILSIGQRLHK